MRLARLFTIKTRFEAFLVIYAIAVGSVERGQHYMATYPGFGGWLLALACTGVVFVAGGKLLDAVRPVPEVRLARVAVPVTAARAGRRAVSRNRPSWRRNRSGSDSAISLHTD